MREGYTPYDLQQYQGLSERALGFDVDGLLAPRMTRREAEKKYYNKYKLTLHSLSCPTSRPDVWISMEAGGYPLEVSIGKIVLQEWEKGIHVQDKRTR